MLGHKGVFMGKDNKKGLYGVLQTVIAASAALVLFALTVMILAGRAYMPMDWHEHIVFKNNGIFFYIAVAGGIAVLIGAFRFIAKIPQKVLFAACNAIFAAAGLFLIINAPSVLRADAGNVFLAAEEFNGGNYASLNEGEYMYMYPHQLGLATFWRPFAALGFGTHAAFTVNLIMALAANFAMWSSARLLWGEDSPAVNYVCVMLFLFLPHLFFILFAYGITPGLCFLCYALYFGIRYLKGKGRFSGIWCVVFAVFSCIVRNNNYIGAIALGTGFILYAIKDKKPVRLVYPAAMLAVTVLSLSLIKWSYGAASGTPVNTGMPKTLWIAMGLQDNEFRMDGWSNAYNEQTYLKYDCDSEKSSAAAKENIKNRLEYFKNNSGKAYEFFSNKLRSTWTEPTFQSLWSGPLADSGQHMKTGFLKELYGGGTAYEAVNRFGSVITALIYICSLAGLIYNFIYRRETGFLGLTVCLYLTGGFLFHAVWETKSQYVYPYVYMMIPFAMGSIAKIAEKICNFCKNKCNKIS